MIKLLVAELRDSWSAWLGVSLSFIMTNAVLGLLALILASAAAPGVDERTSEDFTSMGTINAFLSVVVALAVMGAAATLVINSRRGSVARLALAGATPGQITRNLTAQLATVSLACALVGDVLALAALQPVLDQMYAERGESEGITALTAVYSVPHLLAANVFCAVVAVVGGFRQARRATRIPPVEALRAATGNDRVKFGVGRILGLLIAVGLTVPSLWWIASTIAHVGHSAASFILQGSALLLVMTGVALSMAAPWTIGLFTRIWTKLVPIPDASWHLARHTVIAKGERLARSVVPVMFAVGLVFGMMAMGETFVQTMVASDLEVHMSGMSVRSLLMLLGLPITIAVSGAVGNLIMMSRQRDAELALDGVVGASPAQQVTIPVLEAVIITITASLLGMIMAGVTVWYLGILLPQIGLTFAPGIPWAILLGTFAVCGVITIAATVLPTLPSLSKPAPKVIARLIAE